MPNIYVQYGIEECKKCEQNIIAHNRRCKGKDAIAFQALLGSIFNAVGFRSRMYEQNSLNCGLKIAPWCDKEFSEQFYYGMPMFPRIFIFPGFIKEYHRKWKRMIDSVAGEIDVMQLESVGKEGCFGN